MLLQMAVSLISMSRGFGPAQIVLGPASQALLLAAYFEAGSFSAGHAVERPGHGLSNRQSTGWFFCNA